MAELDDPRVLFAAERTLLAWSRTVAGLMAFGFLVDRAGLLVHGAAAARDGGFWARRRSRPATGSTSRY